MNKNEIQDFKKNLIDTGYVNAYKRSKFLINLYNRICNNFDTVYYNFTEYDLELLGMLPNKKNDLYARRLVNAKSAKSSNIRKKIEYLLVKYENCVFVTLTFDDDCLNNTNSITRRNYVKRFFNEQGLKYVANIDFGQDDKYSKREHYHAICNDTVDCSLWSYIINVERIRGVDCSRKISKYINKFVNHCVKKGACSTRLLCSQHFFV